LTHRIALKANGLIEVAATDAPEIAEATVEPAELVAVTASSSFFPEIVAGTTKLWLSNPIIGEQVLGTGIEAEMVAVLGQEYHL
jgi:hypothetical protein